MIEIVKPQWIVGSERRFFNFIKGLNEKDKIAIVSHTDADGIIAAKIAHIALGANVVRFVGHDDLNDEFVNALKAEKINKIFMCDITFGTRKFLRKIEKFAKVVIVDHHTFIEDLNTTKTVFLDAHGFCATYLCYYLFSKTKDLEKMDWLVVCASLADWMFNSNSKWMEEVYKKYGEKFYLSENQAKSGKFWSIQYNIALSTVYFKDDLNKVFNSLGENFGDIGDLAEYAAIVDLEIAKAISDFYIKKEDFKEGYFMEFESKFPINGVVVNILSSKTPGKTFIVSQKHEDRYGISARRQDKNVNLPELLRKLVEGFENAKAGGHIPAAGASFPLKYVDEFKKRLKDL